MHTSSEQPITISSLSLQTGAISHTDRPSGSALALIYTGGTIGMVASDRGLVPGGRMAERLYDNLQQLPQDRLQALPDFDLITLPRLIDSSNATPEDWLNLNQLISALKGDYQGFIILHGTDTLAYTASALSFLRPASETVLVTGSQYPLEAPDSDARDNLEGALLFAQQLIGQAVHTTKAGLIFFGGRLLQGNRATKVSTYSPEGFDSINLKPLGSCYVGRAHLSHPDDVSAAGEHLNLIRQERPLPQVVILKLWPGIRAEQISSLLSAQVQGVVLESYGSGNAPDLNEPLLAAFKAATDRGVVIVNRSQCPQGPVSMSYAAGSALAEAGIIGAADMTTEAAFSKLTLLLATEATPDAIKAAFNRNFCGEFSV